MIVCMAGERTYRITHSSERRADTRHRTMRLLGLAQLLLTPCAYTREFRDDEGQTIPGSIATMEMLSIGGIRHSLWFRASDTRHPALAILQGGPGASEGAPFRHFNASLEQHLLQQALCSVGLSVRVIIIGIVPG
jgi:hypothetical protein